MAQKSQFKSCRPDLMSQKDHPSLFPEAFFALIHDVLSRFDKFKSPGLLPGFFLRITVTSFGDVTFAVQAIAEPFRTPSE